MAQTTFTAADTGATVLTKLNANAADATSITGTQTLTNKTMTGATNTVTARLLKTATTEVSVAAATAPTAGQVLTATNSTTATWQTPTTGFSYSAKAYRNTSVQAIANVTTTKVQLNGESWDVASEFDSATNYRYTAATTGTYIVTFSVYIQGQSSGSYNQGYVYKNGTTFVSNVVSVPGGAQDVAMSGAGMVQLTAGDYLELYAYQNSGSSKNIYNGEGYTYLTVQRVL